MTNLRFRDFLFPQRLLDETDASDNPFVTHSRRRLGRWWRTALRLVMLATLLFIGWHLMLPAYETESELNALARGNPWGVRIRSLPQGGLALLLWMPLFAPLGALMYFAVVGFFAFLLLRYHLFVNDQSHHLKSIGRDQLEHLLLSRVGPNEYYLHHFLLFCLRYDVIVGWAALMLGTSAVYMLSGGWMWVEEAYWRPTALTLGIVLLTWVAGVFQYVMEWRVFAASRYSYLRLAFSVPISVLAALAIAGFAYFARHASSPAIFGMVAILFAVLASVAFARGKSLYLRAESLVWTRMIGDPNDIPEGVGVPKRNAGRITGLGLLARMVSPWPLYIPELGRGARQLGWKTLLLVLVLGFAVEWATRGAGWWVSSLSAVDERQHWIQVPTAHSQGILASPRFWCIYLVALSLFFAIGRDHKPVGRPAIPAILAGRVYLLLMVASATLLLFGLGWLPLEVIALNAIYVLIDFAIVPLAMIAAGHAVLRSSAGLPLSLRVSASLVAIAAASTALEVLGKTLGDAIWRMTVGQSYWIWSLVLAIALAAACARLLSYSSPDGTDTPSLPAGEPSSSGSTLSPVP